MAKRDWSQVTGPFQIYGLTEFGGLTSRDNWTAVDKDGSKFMGHFRVHSWDLGLYAYFMMHGGDDFS